MTACQRQTRRRTTWRPAGEPFNPARYSVERIAEPAARAYVETHHYSGTWPVSLRQYGLIESTEAGPELVGVACLSVPTNVRVLSNPFPELEPYVESAELGRFVLADRVPGNGESWMLGRVFELAAADGLRGVVSFSDPVARRAASGELVMPGHVGVIYQATNAVYCGRGTARTLRLLPDGSALNDRALQKVRDQDRGHEYVERRLVAAGARARRAGERPGDWLAVALADVGVRRLRHPGNHRYCFRVGSPAVRRRVRLALPAGTYPRPDLALFGA